MSVTKQTAFRLNETDLAIIDAAVKKLGLSSRTEALRFVLRQYADKTNIKIPKRRKT